MTDLATETSVTVVDRMSRDGSKRLRVIAKIDGRVVGTESWIDDKREWSSVCMPRLGGLPPAVTALGYVAKIGPVVIDQREYDAILKAISDLDLVAKATPQGLRQQRQNLVDSLNAARGSEQDQRDTAWEKGDIKGAFADDSRSGAVMAALEEFDAAHPEVYAAIRAEKDRAVKRFMDAD